MVYTTSALKGLIGVTDIICPQSGTQTLTGAHACGQSEKENGSSLPSSLPSSLFLVLSIRVNTRQ